MKKLIVVDNPRRTALQVSGVEMISAQHYLAGSEYATRKNLRVFNLCREYRYQSKGYYVSLLAEARGHKVIPSVKTMQDLKAPAVVKIVSEDLDRLVQHSLRHIRSEEFVLSIYFGENLAKQHLKLAQALYRLFQVPLMRARFVHNGVENGTWSLQHIRAIGMNEIPEQHLPFVQEAATRYFSRRRYDPARTKVLPYDLAILVNPDEKAPPSNKKALANFADAAQQVGFAVESITRDDYGRIGEFDALFIRETTAVNHPTYRFARRAQSEGIVVIDDPDSILRCTNKVYLAELMNIAQIPTPPTFIVHADNRNEVAERLGLPCVLKLPDSSFSQGVTRVETNADLQAALDTMLDTSDLVIAQAYMPTDFDWRIGVLEGEPLYACKYYMARGHWQIYNWNSKTRKDVEGDFESLPIAAVPAPVIETALKACRLIGDGLYGVDLKEIDGRAYLIEVNDNPSIDAGVEDQVLQQELYLRIMRAFRTRIERMIGLAHVPA